jgi:hypothetical protein
LDRLNDPPKQEAFPEGFVEVSSGNASMPGLGLGGGRKALQAGQCLELEQLPGVRVADPMNVLTPPSGWCIKKAIHQ